MNESITLLDPTSEQTAAKRARLTPPTSLDGLTVGLLDIGKARGDVFIEQLGKRLGESGITVKHYAKPTNTKVAPISLAQQVAEECDLVVEALSD